MSVALNRANANGTVNANGTFGRAVVLVDIQDILDTTGITGAEKRRLGVQRLLDEMRKAAEAYFRDDADLQGEADAAQNRANAIIAARPTGDL